MLIEIQVNFYKQKTFPVRKGLYAYICFIKPYDYDTLSYAGIIRIRLITAYAAFKGIKHYRGLISA